jgi:hypothetical protein
MCDPGEIDYVSFPLSHLALAKGAISGSSNRSFILHPTPLPLTRQTDASMVSDIEVAHAFIRDVAGYAFHNSTLLEEALDARGPHSTSSNERLAMIGDSRLKDVVLDDWYPTRATKGMSTAKRNDHHFLMNLTVCDRA